MALSGVVLESVAVPPLAIELQWYLGAAHAYDILEPTALKPTPNMVKLGR